MTPKLPRFVAAKKPLQALIDEPLSGTRRTKHVQVEAVGIRGLYHGEGASVEGETPAVEGAVATVVPDARVASAHGPGRQQHFGGCCVTGVSAELYDRGGPVG